MGGKAALLHHILQRIGLDAFAAAAGFQSVTELMKSTGAGAFIRASMRVQLEAEQKIKEQANGGDNTN